MEGLEKNIAVKNPDEAREIIHSLIENGETPFVTVPERYKEFLLEGLAPHSSWIPGVEIIVGTLGRKPYLPAGSKEPRVLVRIKEIKEDHIQPRFTGPDSAFHGVIVLQGPIPPSSMELVGILSGNEEEKVN